MENVGAGEPIWGRIMRESQGPVRHKTQVLPSCFHMSSQREFAACNIFSKSVSTESPPVHLPLPQTGAFRRLRD